MKKHTTASRAQFDGKLIAYATATAATLGGASSLDASVTNITTADFGGSLPSLSSSQDNDNQSSPFNAAGGSFFLNLHRFKSQTQTPGFTGPGGFVPGFPTVSGGTIGGFPEPGPFYPGIINTFKSASVGIGCSAGQVALFSSHLAKLALNSPISGFGNNGVAFGTNSGGPNGSFNPATGGFVTGYAGFQAGSNFGWLRIKVGRGGDGRPQSIELLADGDGIVGAFGDSSILAGEVAQIPEPATVGIGLGLLALGAAGVREHRRRKAA
jgi:hypothetical protein